MKIKNKKDVEELGRTISHELGIDVSRYRDEEVAEDFVDLLIFPKYMLKWIGYPILLAILIYIFGFFVIELGAFEYLLYGILGFLLFFLMGLFSGILNFLRKLKNDLSSISSYSLGVMKNTLSDIDDIGGRINKGNRKDVFNMLFQGIIHIVTIPMVGNAIDKKLPLAGGMLKGLVKRSLQAVSNRLDFDDDKIDESIEAEEGDSKFVIAYTKGIDKASKGVEGSLGGVSRFLRIPFRILLYLTGIFLAIFLYLIW